MKAIETYIEALKNPLDTLQDGRKMTVLMGAINLLAYGVDPFSPEHEGEVCKNCGGEGYTIVEGRGEDNQLKQDYVRCLDCNPRVDEDRENEQ